LLAVVHDFSADRVLDPAQPEPWPRPPARAARRRRLEPFEVGAIRLEGSRPATAER